MRKQDVLTPSQGPINQILVVIDDDLWLSNVGDTIRNYLAARIDGIIPAEPKFDIDQQSPRIFANTPKSRKNIVYVSTNAEQNKFQLFVDHYAQPQNYFLLEGKDNSNLIENFKQHKDSIINCFHHQEIEDIQTRIKEGPMYETVYLHDHYNIDIDLPASYKRVLVKDNFVWYKKEIASGNSNILVYSLPFSVVKPFTKKIEFIQDMDYLRDSVVGKFIHGSEPDTFMNMSVDFEPFNRTIYLKGQEITEVKGTWDMENSFMGGPYLSYIIKKENYYLVLEGFSYNPSMSKRNVMLELEAIMRTVKVYK
ncbi:DUF4837 family protein [Myroides sp. WP-1]|uniref:DUF4837 family protein n=1 Tax=Myroides sp. WP-1 TaxID=2759944 RepID=UPI0015FE7973|nr:DUF4837 family protein [Myroides sp. WP-1]MBB1139402.1 DUF4837 family protein [Myroides sp. WP-1]